MNAVTIFGLCAVSLMLLTYALESRSRWFTLAFAGSCALGSAYGFLQGAWPFGLVEGLVPGRARQVAEARVVVKLRKGPRVREPFA